MSFKISYAQNREDYLIDAFFPDIKNGFYVDIGAYDPTIDSVTKIFYDRNWRGINVEPLKSKYELFASKRQRDINLNVGIADKEGKLTFTEYRGDGLSTFSEAMQSEYTHSANDNVTTSREYEVAVTTLTNVFTKNKVSHINFMKVDVEGLEYEVLAGNDWTKYRPELLCIESNHVVRDWRPLLKEKHYKKVFFDGLNEYYLAKESLFRQDYFQYPDKFLTGPQIIKWSVKKEIDIIAKNYQDSITSLKASILNQEQAIKNLDTHYNDLHTQYLDNLKLKNLLKNIFRELTKR